MGAIKFLKEREVKNPGRANSTDAGIDFYVPTFTREFLIDLFEKNKDTFSDMSISFDNGSCFVDLPPLSRILIPSGIRCKMGVERMLCAANKSGVASKLGLIFGSQVVDSSYQGEIHISIINVSNDTVKIFEGMKLIQFIETPIILSEIEITTESENFFVEKTQRGDGGFGSSDKKEYESSITTNPTTIKSSFEGNINTTGAVIQIEEDKTIS
jgi:dUTP pyrophosphatase